MTALSDVQQALNIIRQQSDEADWDTKLEMLQLTIATAGDIIALSRKLTKPKQTTKTKTNLIPRTKAVTRYVDAAKPPQIAQQPEDDRSLAAVGPSSPLTPQQQRDLSVRNPGKPRRF